MRARSFAKRHALALEIGDALDRRVLWHEDRLVPALRPDGCDIANPGPTGLRKNRRRVPDETKVNASDIDCLKQRRTELEINPLDLDAKRLERVLNATPLTDSREQTSLLGPDANFGGPFFRLGRRDGKGAEREDACENVTSGIHALVLSGSTAQRLRLSLVRPAPPREKRLCSAFGRACRAKMTAFKAVKGSFG